MERYVVAQLVQFPEEAAHLDLDPAELNDPDHRAIYELLRSGERPGPRFPAHLAAAVAALGAETPSPVDEEQASRALEMAVRRLRVENLRRSIGEVRAALSRGTGDLGGLTAEIERLTDELDAAMRAGERETVLEDGREDREEGE